MERAPKASRSLRGLLLAAGVLAAFTFALPAAAAPRKSGAATVEYWVGAVPVPWNVAPSEKDPIMGTQLDPAKTNMQTVIYRGFTAGWTAQLPPQNQGLVGPIIHARVGDTILVHFKNFDPNAPHSMHFHGVTYDPPSDGAYIPGVSGPGADVQPGQTFTYKLLAGPDAAGVWPYHDHSPSMDQSIAGGLYGALSILGKNQPKPNREFVVFFETTLKFNTVDGLAFIGNTPTFHAKVGDLVQWDVLALGDDTHSFHVHGHRFITADGTRDVQTVSPASSFEIRWKEDRPGTWLYHCHVETHMNNGMIGLYVVTK
jgi:FtsP/CotA-like multicopper oxidase with cupredoxin domain